jgi:hypothetical protein
MVLEVLEVETFLKEIATKLRPKGKLLIVEPRFHVSELAIERTLEAAQSGIKADLQA